MNTPVNEPRPDHERRDVDVVALFAVVLLMFFSCALIFTVVAAMLRFFELREPSKTAGQASLPATRSEQFPKPRLEIKPGGNLEALRAVEHSDLTTYAWIDRNTGIVRVPINRAMQLILEHGLPDVGGGQTPLSLMQARPNETATPRRLMQSP